MSDNITQLVALAIIMAAVIMSMGEPDLIDGINYWLTDGAFTPCLGPINE